MLMKCSFIFAVRLFVCGLAGMDVCAQNMFHGSPDGDDIIAKYRHFTAQQLLDAGDDYYYKNHLDTALICFSMVVNIPVKEADTEGQRKTVAALNKAGVIYRHLCDYRKSYELLIKGLDLCEKYGFDSYRSKFYTNIGDIYYRFKKLDIAQSYALKALEWCSDTASAIIILNNLGHLELESGKTDSVFYRLNRALQISCRHNSIYLDGIQNSLASYWQKTGQYDSAYHYFRLSLGRTERNNNLEYKAENLSGLGKLFFETGKNDSALFYINLSNTIASENNFKSISAENCFVLSKIEESKGWYKTALEHLKRYAGLKDSIFDIDKFGEINQLQRLYEVSKTNRQIEQLAIEQQIRERTIRYQRIIWLITLGVLLLVSGVLLFVFFQKRKLNIAYKTLFEKNMKIMELQESEKQPRKYQKSTLTDARQRELLDKILMLMEDTAVICDPDFSINRLAEMVQSNHNHVSQVINGALKKNFRSLINGYRIREVQRLFAEPETARFTIESIAHRVGFKSQTSFREAFKEATGISPNFYLKSMNSSEASDQPSKKD